MLPRRCVSTCGFRAAVLRDARTYPSILAPFFQQSGGGDGGAPPTSAAPSSAAPEDAESSKSDGEGGEEGGKGLLFWGPAANPTGLEGEDYFLGVVPR